MRVAAGEWVAVTGPSGSGKSALVLITGLAVLALVGAGVTAARVSRRMGLQILRGL